MGGYKLGVVGEHVVLVVQHHFDIVPAERVWLSAGKAVGQIGQIVDQHGNQHEEDHAEAAVFQKALEVQLPAPDAADHPDRPDHSEPRTRVEAGPLAGGAQTEGDAGERQVPFPLPADKLIHEQIHQEDEEDRVDVDGGNAGLDKVHEIRGHQSRAGRPSRAPG